MDDSKQYDAKQDSHLDRLKDNSLKAAGYAYMIGDAALFASGRMAGRPKEANAGLIYVAGGALMARYGNPKAEKKLELLSRRLGHYLEKQGVTIPQNPDTASLTRPEGVIDHAESFFYKYPSQIFNSFITVAGVELLRSGISKRKPWDTASGALVAAGALAGLLIPEKKPDPQHPPENFLEKAREWIQEKPLRVPGILWASNNVTLTMSAIDEMRKNPAQKSYLFKFLTAASYLFANSLFSISSKGHGGCDNEDNKDMLEKLAAVSAQVVAAQAPPVREALVQQVAAFISAQPESHMKADEIADMLHQKLAEAGRGAVPTANWLQRSRTGANLTTPSL